MKTTLPKKSRHIQDRLNKIVAVIKDIGQDKIAMIILYGSYARGDWISDVYVENHTTHSYQSDLDILVVLRHPKYMEHEARRMDDKLKEIFCHKSNIDMMTKPTISIIFEPINRVNKEIENGRSFFCDIRKQGVLLYDSEFFTLSEARKLPWSKRKPIAQKDYEYWFESAMEFLIDCHNALGRASFKISAFYLHQATEHLYHTTLLIFTGYQPRIHDLEKLNIRARKYSYELYKIFPGSTPEEKKCFELLKDAYVRARYDTTYEINKEQLIYLIERVEKLKAVTEEICLRKLES